MGGKTIEQNPNKGFVRNLVCVSDMHIGCRLGLMHPDGARLDDGGVVKPSKVQRVMWGWWEEFWGEWVPRVTKGESWLLVVVGDGIEGVHHRATTPWSTNITDQRRHAVKILEPIISNSKCAGLKWIRGTEAHVGPSARDEEDLAAELGAIPNAEGQYARWELWQRLGPRQEVVNLAHHIGVTSSAQHETSALNAMLSRLFVDAGRWGLPPPNAVVRAHRHRSSEVRLPAKWGYAHCVVLPAWQLKTPYVYKRDPGAVSQIGGGVIRAGDEELYTRLFVRDIGRPNLE